MSDIKAMESKMEEEAALSTERIVDEVVKMVEDEGNDVVNNSTESVTAPPTDAAATTNSTSNSWQFNKSVIECNRFMLENNIACDITFAVSNHLKTGGIENGASECGDSSYDVKFFKAHKYVLASRSPIFHTMLYGDVAEKGEVINVDDVEPEAFKQMLSYIYTDEFELKPTQVLSILGVSSKYLLPGLSSKCTDFLAAQLDAKNACTLLDQSLEFGENDLTEKCLQLVKSQTRVSLESDSFLDVSRSALSKILDVDMFSLKEVEVFDASLKWAKKKCEDIAIESTGSNVRHLLGDCLYKFRFPDMEFTEFGRVVAPSGVLSVEEELALYRYISCKEVNPAPVNFCDESRFKQGPYDVISSEKIETVNIGSTVVTMNIECSTDIEIKNLIIGTWHGIHGHFRGFGVSEKATTTLQTVTYNGKKVNGYVSKQLDVQKQEWKVNGSLKIKAGESTMSIVLVNDFAAYRASAYVNVLSNKEVVFKDNFVELKFKSNQVFMPILGLTYMMV